MHYELIITSILLGGALAMDAFSVSIANGLADRNMKKRRMLAIAGTFAAFQFLMPMAGWFLVKRMTEVFEWFSPLVPWIALILLLIIGAGLLKDGIGELRNEKSGAGAETTAVTAPNIAAAPDTEATVAKDADIPATATLTVLALLGQGVATSIDALSVGFTTASYDLAQALLSSFIIGVVTLVICLAGLRIGRRLGELLAGRASILGGVILIAIGLEIWIKGVFL